MIIDNKAMLDRVVTKVFNEDFVTTRVSPDKVPGTHAVEVSRRYHKERTAIIRVDHVSMYVFIPELNVSAGVFLGAPEEDDDPEDVIQAEREGELRRLCRLMHVYLGGGGLISERRSLLGRGIVRRLVIESDGFEWRLGRNASSGPKPI
ncbi:hypothetical protein [Arthrobacter sp. HLT1-21]